MTATYSREKIILFYLPIQTKDVGIVYQFVAQDIFSEFIFGLNIAKEINLQEVIKVLDAPPPPPPPAIEEKQAFTLVIERSLLPFIDGITKTIKEHSGSLALDDDFVNKKAQEFGRFIENRNQ